MYPGAPEKDHTEHTVVLSSDLALIGGMVHVLADCPACVEQGFTPYSVETGDPCEECAGSGTNELALEKELDTLGTRR